MDGYTAHQIVILGAKRDHEVSASKGSAHSVHSAVLTLSFAQLLRLHG